MIKGAVALVLIAALVAVAVAVRRDRSASDPPVYATAKERTAGQVALRFANLDRGRDGVRACGLAAGRLRQEMRCDHAPRPSGALEYGLDEPFEVIAAVSSRSGLIYIHLTPGNPVASIAVNAQGKVESIEHYGTG